MATLTQDAIDTFMSITGASNSVAVRKLQVIRFHSLSILVFLVFLDVILLSVTILKVSRIAEVLVRWTIIWSSDSIIYRFKIHPDVAIEIDIVEF